MTAEEAEAFLSEPAVLEEKVDGANLGISFDAQGRMRFQNRGQWLTGKLSGQWETLRVWAAQHEESLRKFLPARHILFGEWCHALHSIRYDQLPDWFLGFDVFDCRARRFWSVARRNSLLDAVHVAAVPAVATGRFRIPDILRLLDGLSSFASSPREGLYLRRDKGDWLEGRAKVVCAEFTQAIGEHWSRRQFLANATVAQPVICVGGHRSVPRLYR
jgi:hypothetical protein